MLQVHGDVAGGGRGITRDRATAVRYQQLVTAALGTAEQEQRAPHDTDVTILQRGRRCHGHEKMEHKYHEKAGGPSGRVRKDGERDGHTPTNLHLHRSISLYCEKHWVKGFRSLYACDQRAFTRRSAGVTEKRTCILFSAVFTWRVTYGHRRLSGCFSVATRPWPDRWAEGFAY